MTVVTSKYYDDVEEGQQATFPVRTIVLQQSPASHPAELSGTSGFLHLHSKPSILMVLNLMCKLTLASRLDISLLPSHCQYPPGFDPCGPSEC